MEDLKPKIDELADLIDEFMLDEATLKGDGWRVSFGRNAPSVGVSDAQVAADPDAPARPTRRSTDKKVQAPVGIPISSPMMGTYYNAPSPGSPPFVTEGQPVTAGQVVALIEAMKVFNEITATVSGTVGKIPAKNGALVNPGDVLVTIV